MTDDALDGQNSVEADGRNRLYSKLTRRLLSTEPRDETKSPSWSDFTSIIDYGDSIIANVRRRENPQPMAIRFQMLIAIALLACGCNSQNDDTSQVDASSDWTPAELSERQNDLYHYLLSELEEPAKYVDLDEPDGRIYCLTLTPMDQWGDTGTWRNIPTNLLREQPDLNTWYRPATDAYLNDGRVLTKDSNARAWMEWITIRRWLSETKAEVQSGVWCCPMGGGASTRTYEKIDGKWRITDYGESWVS